MTGFRIALALLAAVIPIHAQIPQPPSSLDADAAFNYAANAIVDRDPRDQAWAAELIATRHFEAPYPKLLTALAVAQPSPSRKFEATPEELVIEVIADAVIRTVLRVPAADARKLYPEFPALAMILLSRPLDHNQAALNSILHESDVPDIWLAAADLLAAHPTPDFVIRQLDDFSIFTRFPVSEPGAGMGASYVDCIGPFLPQSPKPPADWPPVAVYQLALKNGDAVVASGANDVSFLRKVPANPRPWKGSSCGGPEIRELRRDLLLQLSGIAPSATRLRAVVLESLTHKTDQQYLRDATAILQERAQSFADIVNQLQSQGLLTQAEAAERHLHLQVHVLSDASGKQIPPFPDLRLLGIIGEVHPNPF